MAASDQKRSEYLTFRIGEEDKERVVELARQDERSVSQLLGFAVREYLQRRKAGAPIIPTETPFADDAELAAAWAALEAEYRKELRRTILAAAAREAAEKASDTAPEGPAPEDKPKTGSGAG